MMNCPACHKPLVEVVRYDMFYLECETKLYSPWSEGLSSHFCFRWDDYNLIIWYNPNNSIMFRYNITRQTRHINSIIPHMEEMIKEPFSFPEEFVEWANSFTNSLLFI